LKPAATVRAGHHAGCRLVAHPATSCRLSLRSEADTKRSLHPRVDARPGGRTFVEAVVATEPPDRRWDARGPSRTTSGVTSNELNTCAANPSCTPNRPSNRCSVPRRSCPSAYASPRASTTACRAASVNAVNGTDGAVMLAIEYRSALSSHIAAGSQPQRGAANGSRSVGWLRGQPPAVVGSVPGSVRARRNPSHSPKLSEPSLATPGPLLVAPAATSVRPPLRRRGWPRRRTRPPPATVALTRGGSASDSARQTWRPRAQRLCHPAPRRRRRPADDRPAFAPERSRPSTPRAPRSDRRS